MPLASIDGMADLTVTINSLSKTYSVTGWRVGWAIAPEWLTGGYPGRFTISSLWGPPHFFRRRGAAALSLPDDYYAELARDYTRRRDQLLEILQRYRFVPYRPGEPTTS